MIKERLQQNRFFQFMQTEKIYFSWALLSLYLFCVLFAEVMLNVPTIDLMLIWAVLCFIFAVTTSFFALYFCAKFTLKNQRVRSTRRIRVCFIAAFCIMFAVLLVHLLAYFPGCYSSDSASQYLQALSGDYSDWHPYVHTLLFFTLPMFICDELWFLVLLQIVYFSFAVAYLIKTLARFQAHAMVLVATLLFFVCNVELADMMMFPWKDCALIIFALIATTQFMNIYFTKGAWLNAKRNCVAFGVVLTIATLVRHNAILFTLALLCIVVLFYFKNAKRILLTCATFALLVFIAKVPLYNALDVTTPNYRTVEVVGLPMSIIAETVKVEPESLSDELLDFAYAVAPQEEWEDYNGYGWNDFKWASDWDVVEDAGTVQVLQYMIDATAQATTTAIKGFLRTTSCVWSVTRELNIDCYIISNTDGFESSYNPTVETMLDIQTMANEILSTIVNVNMLLYSIGFAMLTMMLAACTRTKDVLEKLLLIAPVFCYNLGTMLLLTGQDTRFFVYTLALVPPLLFMIFSPRQTALTELLQQLLQFRKGKKASK